MMEFSARSVLVVVLLVVAVSPEPKQAQRPPVFDPERLFMLGDADLDGRLSLDEYRDFLRSSLRMRGAVGTIELMFRRLDTDRDGFLSMPEYSKSFPQEKPSTRSTTTPKPAPAGGITPRAGEVL